MILILDGIVFLIKDMAKLDMAITNITDKAITKVGCICVVTANAEQIPKTCMVIGLLSIKGSVTILFLLLEKSSSAGFLLIFFSTVSVLIIY
jgi:hypothetical protein